MIAAPFSIPTRSAEGFIPVPPYHHLSFPVSVLLFNKIYPNGCRMACHGGLGWSSLTLLVVLGILSSAY
jgi:hypothetical protein